MAKIENHKYSVEEAFRECFYIVPDYQREYVWTDKEVNQLLEDINDELDASNGREYFIGTVLVSPTDLKNHYEVIDGQQRLTTFFLLLCVLKNIFENEPQYQTINGLISTSYTTSDGDTKTSLKLDPRYENAKEVMDMIVKINSDYDQTKNAIQNAGISVLGSLENLLHAYGNIYNYLQVNYPNISSLRKYWGYLANNVVFIQISTDVSSALKIFETINERGVGLNPMDLLKNLLFTHVKAEEFSKLKDEWKKITGPLEQHKKKPLRFLRYFLMANYKIENARKDGIVREDEIYDWFTNKKNAALCDYQKKPFEFVRKIIRNVNNYIAYSNGKGNDKNDNLYMDNLSKLCGGAFSLHYVLLLATSTLPKMIFDHFVRQLESFLFYYIFTKTPTKELERNFSAWADELRKICDIGILDLQKQQLNDFLRSKLHENIQAKDEQLEDDLKRYTLYSMQQYRIRYFLSKIAQHVDMAYKGLSSPGSLNDYTVLQIEHILPNNPKDELRNDFELKNTDKSYDEYKNKLGNFTLLEKPINIVAGNDFYEKKCSEYLKSKYYLTSSLVRLNVVGNNSSINRINQKLIAFSEWNADTIDQRQNMLINLAKGIWRIEEIETE